MAIIVRHTKAGIPRYGVTITRNIADEAGTVTRTVKRMGTFGSMLEARFAEAKGYEDLPRWRSRSQPTETETAAAGLDMIPVPRELIDRVRTVMADYVQWGIGSDEARERARATANELDQVLHLFDVLSHGLRAALSPAVGQEAA